MPPAPPLHTKGNGWGGWPNLLCCVGVRCGHPLTYPPKNPERVGNPAQRRKPGFPGRTRRVLTPQGLPCWFEGSFMAPCRLWEATGVNDGIARLYQGDRGKGR